MRKLNAYQKAKMTDTAVESLSDICTIHTPTKSQNSLGEVISTWTDTSNVACGFNPSNSYKTNRGQRITLDCDAILRLSTSQTINIGCEITTHTNRYSISGITVGKTVNIVTLKRASPND